MISGTSIREIRLGMGQRAARNAGIPVTVDDRSSDEEIEAFCDRALRADVAQAERLNRRIGPLTSADRRKLFQSHPEYARLSAREILHRIGDTGLRGTAAIKLAIRRTPPDARGVAARSREQRAPRRVASGSAASETPPRLAPRACKGCGADFAPTGPRQRYHDERCATASRVRRHRERLAPTTFDRYRDVLFAAQRDGILDAFDALALAVFPSEEIIHHLRRA